MNSIDQTYYLRRASDHRKSADSAKLPTIAQIHLELARNYETLAGLQEVEQEIAFQRSA